MTIEQLIKLIDAGFTREEISALVNSTVEPANNSNAEPANNSNAAPETNSTTNVNEEHNAAPADSNQILIDTINKLTQTIQASNIGRSQMGNPQPPLTADDVLASIIAPNNR